MPFRHAKPCAKYLNGSTIANINNHFKTQHADIVKEYEEKKTSAADALEWLRRHVTKLIEGNRTQLKLQSKASQRTVLGIKTVFFIGTSDSPLAISDNPWLDAIAGSDHSRRLIYSRQTVSRIVPVVAEALRVLMRRRLDSLASLSATYDGWQNARGEAMQSLTIHYIDDNWHLHAELATVAPAGGSRTGSAVAASFNAALSAATSDFTLLAGSTADGAANEQLGGELIQGEGEFNMLTCSSHTLQLVIRAGTGVKDIVTVTSKIHFLVQTIRRHRLLREKLAKLCSKSQKSSLDVLVDE